MNNYPIKIGGKKYKLSLTNHKTDEIFKDNEEANGYIKYDLSEINIRSSNSSDVIKESIIHELLHALLDDSGVEDLNTEKLVKILTPRLNALLEDNPEFIMKFIKNDFTFSHI